MTGADELATRCERLRWLHVPGTPLVLANAWDVASAKAVAAAGFPAVATTSGGVAASLGYEDHEGAPAAEMLAAAGRIVRGVDVPVTVDAEAGYALGADDLVAALAEIGAAGLNLEDTRHAEGALAEAHEHADWLRAVRTAADARGYRPVLNARIDVFLSDRSREHGPLVPEALRRARLYFEAGADCVFPIGLWEADAIAEFTAGAGGPVNILAVPAAPPLPELAALGVARISYGSLVHAGAMRQLADTLAAIAAAGGAPAAGCGGNA